MELLPLLASTKDPYPTPWPTRGPQISNPDLPRPGGEFDKGGNSLLKHFERNPNIRSNL